MPSKFLSQTEWHVMLPDTHRVSTMEGGFSPILWFCVVLFL